MGGGVEVLVEEMKQVVALQETTQNLQSVTQWWLANEIVKDVEEGGGGEVKVVHEGRQSGVVDGGVSSESSEGRGVGEEEVEGDVVGGKEVFPVGGGAEVHEVLGLKVLQSAVDQQRLWWQWLVWKRRKKKKRKRRKKKRRKEKKRKKRKD